MNKLKDIEEFKKLSKKLVINEISNYINSQIELNNRERLKKDNYTSPGWAYRQADLTGELRTLHKLLDYLP